MRLLSWDVPSGRLTAQRQARAKAPNASALGGEGTVATAVRGEVVFWGAGKEAA